MKWPLVRRSKYDDAVRDRDTYFGAYQESVQLTAARIQPTVTVSDTQVQTVVAAIDRAADEIVAAVKSVP
jgi:hypothetical protein